uniref:Uncharacterized protein n=1 Tax=Arundo donax TaxID=35708 RepID=A0A0A9EVS7_ARUDO
MYLHEVTTDMSLQNTLQSLSMSILNGRRFSTFSIYHFEY